jgi:fructose/tagatose bisphosphate aldolase
VRSGLTKINIATALNKVFTGSVRAALAGDERLVDPRKYMAAGREAVAEEVARLLAVLASP